MSLWRPLPASVLRPGPGEIRRVKGADVGCVRQEALQQRAEGPEFFLGERRVQSPLPLLRNDHDAVVQLFS